MLREEDREFVAALLREATAVSVAAERERCAAIVQAARFGEVDRDFRAIIHMIEGGQSVDDLKSEAK